MSEEKGFFSKTKSHWDNDNDWNPEAGSGIDTISTNVPDQFTRYSVELLTPPGVSGYEVLSAPTRGSSGNQKFRIKWYYAPFGKVSYRLHAYSGKRQRIEIVVDAHNWLNEVKDAIEQGLEIRLVVRGIQARDLYRQILMLAPNDLAVPSDLFFERDAAITDGGKTPASDSENGDQLKGPASEAATIIAITLGICAALVIIAGFATIAGILMMAIHHGYSVDTSHFKAETSLGTFELSLDLQPPK